MAEVGINATVNQPLLSLVAGKVECVSIIPSQGIPETQI
jgi:hypothetical protein